MREHVLIDTNVALSANGENADTSILCKFACINRLQEVRKDCNIVLDSCGLILREYFKNHPHGTPQGIGDRFMIWAFDNQANPDRCVKATVTPVTNSAVSQNRNDPDPDLEEFPSDAALKDFDRQDRKFVAAAISSAVNPTIVNAVDSDWKIHHKQLSKYVKLEHLCL